MTTTRIASSAPTAARGWYGDVAINYKASEDVYLKFTTQVTALDPIYRYYRPTQANENWRLLPQSNQFIWWSQRDNWIHLYLCDLESGELVNPITTADYSTPAERPSYSLLDCTATRKALDLPPTHWLQALRHLLEATA